ncbi:transposase, partial [Facilibium subflavum]|uniref:transposase n=1 Tax=Facilibium subflavum TaxID=2219058 RepID=UPI001AAE09B6
LAGNCCRRAGIEGTISQATRTTDARKSKYVGLKKTHLQQIASAAAINIHRIIDWITDKTREETRESSFGILQPKAA